MEKDLKSLIDKSIRFRGEIIEKLSGIEEAINIYLVTHFSDDETKQDELMKFFFATDRISFDTKREILDYLLTTYRPEFLSKYKELKGDLISLIKDRNVIAHAKLDTSEEAILSQDQQLTYIRFKNKEIRIVYTENYVQMMRIKIIKCKLKLLMVFGFESD
ncbi:hypothetical protein IM792_02925 [Mucilaginibacter sp. JRF]|uniref:hypothetical protein n=1 Tax=Mucilaginibacter sp. JRF TaxID=2780088 RepID=UPI001882A00F|nr:hypothetical protein [Mucilaginibacter sp. JRF]MBE9583389.1 hypothetical protein [Mucilaginibacter sp. JRF]